MFIKNVKEINFMIKILLFVLFLNISTYNDVKSSPKVNFSEIMSESETNPTKVRLARESAISKGLPVSVLSKAGVIIAAKGIENGKIVYAVITNFANPYSGGYTLYQEDIFSIYRKEDSKIDYGNGIIVDNTGEFFNPVVSRSSGLSQYLMIPDWTLDNVYLFNAQNGDLVDDNFILPSNPHLQSPKEALQHLNGKQIIVSDQISDVVQRFDTNGTYIGVYAPAGGPNPSILDNIRGISYRPNRNLLVTVGSGPNSNTVQQFDSGGIHIGPFISANLSSPFDVLLRPSDNDILVTNSSGTRITRFDLNGVFISNFYSGTAFAFPQQIVRLQNGNVAIAAFSPPSGIALLDSSGNFLRLLTGATGLRGVYQLGNGRYLTTNGAGVHEIDSASGNLIRTVVAGINFQYISLYVPGIVVSTENNNQIIDEYKLYSNFPNPFNPSTVIKFSLPRQAKMKLSVYNINGKIVSVLSDEVKNSGIHEIIFEADNLPTGTYFYKLETEEFTDHKKMVFLK